MEVKEERRSVGENIVDVVVVEQGAEWLATANLHANVYMFTRSLVEFPFPDTSSSKKFLSVLVS